MPATPAGTRRCADLGLRLNEEVAIHVEAVGVGSRPSEATIGVLARDHDRGSRDRGDRPRPDSSPYGVVTRSRTTCIIASVPSSSLPWMFASMKIGILTWSPHSLEQRLSLRGIGEHDRAELRPNVRSPAPARASRARSRPRRTDRAACLPTDRSPRTTSVRGCRPPRPRRGTAGACTRSPRTGSVRAVASAGSRCSSRVPRSHTTPRRRSGRGPPRSGYRPTGARAARRRARTRRSPLPSPGSP